MKKIKVCSIILTVLSVIGICLSIIKLIAQYNGFAILKHSGGANGWFVAVKASDSFLIYIVTFVLALFSVALWLLYKKKRINRKNRRKLYDSCYVCVKGVM